MQAMALTLVLVVPLALQSVTQAQKPVVIPTYLIYPVTTDLQKHLLPSRASVVVIMDTNDAFKDGTVSLKRLKLTELRKDLKKYMAPEASAHFTLFFKHGEGSMESQDLLRYAVLGWAHQWGFPKVAAYGHFPNRKVTWSEFVEAFATAKPRQPDGDEVSRGKDSVKAYAVRTELSRYLTSDADCVVVIDTSLNAGAIPAEISRTASSYVGELMLAHKKKVTFVTRHVHNDHIERLLDEFRQLGNKLGFESSTVSLR